MQRTQQFVTTNGVSVWGAAVEQLPLFAISNQVPSNLVKGTSGAVCSAILYGNWSDLLIGMWGGLDVLLDPYSLSLSGGRRIVVMQSVDISVRHPESFAAMLDALTV